MNSFDIFKFSPEIQERVHEIKKALEPKLLGPAFSVLTYDQKIEVAKRLLKDRSGKMNSLNEYGEVFDFSYRNQIFEEVTGLSKPEIRKLCWTHCKNSCLTVSTSYIKNLSLSTALGDLLLPEIFRDNDLKCSKADTRKEYPDYKLVVEDRTLAYIDFKYRAVPYFFIDKQPYHLFCYYCVAEDLAKIDEHYGQVQRAKERGEKVHPTFHLYFVDYPCISCIVFQNVEVLHKIKSESGRAHLRKNVWTTRESKKSRADISTYFSILTDLREITDLTYTINKITNVEDIEEKMSVLKDQDMLMASKLYGSKGN